MKAMKNTVRDGPVAVRRRLEFSAGSSIGFSYKVKRISNRTTDLNDFFMNEWILIGVLNMLSPYTTALFTSCLTTEMFI